MNNKFTADEILPAFKDNYSVWALRSSNEYVPYLLACLASFAAHMDVNHNYDVLVFESKITPKNKEIIRSFLARPNVSVRFVNPREVLAQYELRFPAHYSLECFFSVTAPLMLKNYSRVLFTDLDVIIRRDLRELYEIDLHGKPMAAALDYAAKGMFESNNWDLLAYTTDSLKLANPRVYYNTGVCVFDLDYFRAHNCTAELLQMLHGSNFRYLEQDALNIYFQGKIRELPVCWNWPPKNSYFNDIWAKMPAADRRAYEAAEREAGVVHYIGIKPWVNPEEHSAWLWWGYFRQTPLYETWMLENLRTSVRRLIWELPRCKVSGYWFALLGRAALLSRHRKAFREKARLYKEKLLHGNWNLSFFKR